MLILGLETSTSRSSVALVDGDRVVASASLGVDRRHGEFVAPAIDFCLRQAGMSADRITGVAVGIGPGLFTGLRVGIATAQAIAGTRHLPVVGMCSLDVLAFQVRHVRRLICAVLDARRGELFWAFYRSSPGGVQRQGDLRVGNVDTLEAEIAAQGSDVLAVGEGALAHREQLANTDTAVAGLDVGWPDAAVLAELCVPRFVREDTQTPLQLQPLYLRQADAQIGWATRGRLRGGEGA
ncbi:MAG: tRNA (adenosine(37)-N6)-threonylcarbamoyltransferase complex dimerization subunit type 1 TsaB [Nitriliruptoraceae bacterium]